MMIQKWHEELKPILQEIKREMFDVTTYEEEYQGDDRLRFGDAKEKYILEVSRRNIIEISRGLFRPTDENVEKIGGMIAKFLRKEKIRAIVYANIYFGTDRVSETIIQNYIYARKFLSQHNFRHIPTFTILPSAGVDYGVFLSHERDYAVSFTNTATLRGFVNKQLREEEKMNAFERKMEQMVLRYHTSIRKTEKKGKKGISYVDEEQFFLTFSVYKTYIRQNEKYVFSYQFGENKKKYKHENLEHLLNYAKKKIQAYLEEQIPKKIRK